MSQPNFFVIGQMRAGTTFLYSVLRAHPEVFLPELKETRFFNHSLSDPKRDKKVRGNRPVTLDDYLKLYAAVEAKHTAIGDISPQYIESEFAGPQIKEFDPAARIIATLREPAQRMYSLFQLSAESRSPNETFRQNFENGIDQWQGLSSFTYKNLQRYYDIFPHEQILPMLFNDLTKNTEAAKTKIANHLGVATEWTVEQSKVLQNSGAAPSNALLGRALKALRKASWLRELMPEFVADIGRSLKDANSKALPKMTEEDAAFIREFYREDTLRLQDLIKADLSGWLSNTSAADP